MWWLTTFLSLLIAALAPRAAGAARADRLIGGRVDAVVAVAGGAVSLREGVALFVDAQGRVRGRCADSGPAGPPVRTRAARDVPDVEDVLRFAGLPDDDDGSPEAEDALEEEGLGPRPRARPTRVEEPTVVQAIAAAPAGEVVWLATSSGLFRARADGSACARWALHGLDVALVAAAGAQVVAVSEDTVWRSLDGGASFEVAAVLGARPRAVVVSGDGAHALIATDDGVFDPIAPHAVSRVLEQGAVTLAACGDTVLILADDGTYVWAPGSVAARVGPRPPARGLACGATAAPSGRRAARWAAAGAGLWTSGDGVTWTEEPAPAGLSLAGAAPADDGWWLATDDGLVRTHAGPKLERGADEEGGAQIAAPARARRAPEIWAAALPRVSAAFGGRVQTGARAEWHVWLLVTVPLGRSPRWIADLVAIRVETTSRRAALEAEARGLQAVAAGDEEAAARSRALSAEWEALR
jgi:hypothetical protein